MGVGGEWDGGKEEIDSLESTWGFVWDNLFAFYSQPPFKRVE